MTNRLLLFAALPDPPPKGGENGTSGEACNAGSGGGGFCIGGHAPPDGGSNCYPGSTTGTDGGCWDGNKNASDYWPNASCNIGSQPNIKSPCGDGSGDGV